MSGYENYTLSPVPWIKQMPGHWGLVRGKNLYQKMQRPTSDTDEVVTCFRDGTVTLRKNRRTTGFTESLKEIGYQGIRKGDLVIHVMDAFAGSIGVSDSDGKGTPVYSVCQAKGNSNNQYYALLLREMARSGYIQSLYRGIRERSSDFRFEVFAAQFYPVPPRDEQDQIVRFLDWKVSSINKMIAIKEKRRSLIFDLIQLYLFSDDASQFSIGRIENAFPKNWESIKAKHIFSERKEKGHAEEELLAVTQDKGVVFKKDCDNHYVQPSNLEDQKLVCPGDFIISLRSFQGGIEHSRIKGLVSAAYTVMELSPAYSHIEEYYGFLFKSKPFIQYLNSCVNDIRDGKKIDYKDFRDCSLPIPPISTLEKINALRKEYDNATEELNRYATLLRELRMCIISDTVTGKIDVRGIEIPEYESVDKDIDNADEIMEQGVNEPLEEE